MKLGFFQSIAITVGSTIILTGNSVVAQITPDATLPNNSQVRLQDNIRFIEGGTQIGGNLFHSFKEFSVPTNSMAHFNNATDVQNILTRVTGGSISNIDGLIRANDSANLFLVNPSGIIFGQNARLDIGGSFLASTANSVKFSDGSFFSASDNGRTPLLTIGVPIGLQIGASPKSITVKGSGHNLTYNPLTYGTIRTDVPGLQVRMGKTLALVGGNIILEGGNLRAESGRIELGSVASPSLVNLTQDNLGFALDYSNVNNFGNIQLSQKASADASGEGGGSIQVQTGKLSVRDGSSILSITTGSKAGGDFIVNATELIELLGESTDKTYASSLYTESQGSGSSGNMTIHTKNFTATDGAYVSTFITSSGNGGDLFLTAFDTVDLKGKGIYAAGLYTATSPDSSGNSGNLTVETVNLNLSSGAWITAQTNENSTGAAGNLTINTRELIVQDRGQVITSTSAAGEGGNLTINTSEFLARDGGQIFTSTFATGNGGNLTVNATNKIELIGQNKVNRLFTTGLFTTQESENATGNAGNLTINTSLLRVSDGAVVDASTFGAGRGGNLKITTDQLLVRNASILVQSLGTGTAGNLTIDASSINLDSDALLTANTPSNGLDQATINIKSADLILRHGSNITTNATGSDVTGGNINIKTNNLALLERSNMTANSTDARGGNININTQGLFQRENSIITARGATSELSGNVNITTLVDPSRGTTELPQYIVNAAPLINQNFCARAYNSSFTITGRGGIIPSPYDVFAGETTWEDWRVNPIAQGRGEGQRVTSVMDEKKVTTTAPKEVVEAQGWVVNKKGQMELVATAQNVTPHKLQSIPVECLQNTAP